MAHYAIGLDYGTNSVRALLVDLASKAEVATSIYEYPSGTAGIITDPRDPLVARQNPQDYVDGALAVIRGVLADAAQVPAFHASLVVGIGVDTTGSTPIPVNAEGTPLASTADFLGNIHAMAVLWKDHTAHAEAAEITKLAARIRPHYLAKCGGIYSSEWFWAKILHNIRAHPEVSEHVATWVEHADWLPAVLCGLTSPDLLRRGICAAGHKGFYSTTWGGFPDAEFLTLLDPRLVDVLASLPEKVYHVGEKAGNLSAEWARLTGLLEGTPVSIGAFDAHLGAVGAGITPGALVKIIGTSTCDLMIAPLDSPLPDIPGLCGVVPESVIPGYYGLEAGQSAVGDIFNWFVNVVQPANLGHSELTSAAEKLSPGESGLIALDWHNGNRTVLVDQRLTGSVIGLTLQTTPAELYRAWIEATAYGARVIVERLEESGQLVNRIINCGGIAAKNPLVMQIYADVLGRPIQISASAQTCALGSAIAGAVAAGAFATFSEATAALTSLSPDVFYPDESSSVVYDKLFHLYKQVHDAFGVDGGGISLYNVMKDLLVIREEASHAV
jgi:L-ribulokinase